MWIFLNDAFLSIVAVSPRGRNAPTSSVADRAKLLLVRGRIAGDIERVFPAAKVRRTDDRDYRYRAYVSREDVAPRLAEAVTAISYRNFKNSVAPAETRRHGAYLLVWETVWRFQQALRDA